MACWLTTKDNPWNPFTNLKEWDQFDKLAGYDSSGKVARIAQTSDSFTDEENAAEKERAIDRIIALDFTNTFVKLVVNDEELDDETAVKT